MSGSLAVKTLNKATKDMAEHIWQILKNVKSIKEIGYFDTLKSKVDLNININDTGTLLKNNISKLKDIDSLNSNGSSKAEPKIEN